MGCTYKACLVWGGRKVNSVGQAALEYFFERIDFGGQSLLEIHHWVLRKEKTEHGTGLRYLERNALLVGHIVDSC